MGGIDAAATGGVTARLVAVGRVGLAAWKRWVHQRMAREHDDAMDRLNRLGEKEPEPILIVPATPHRDIDELPPPTATMPVDPAEQFTVAQPMGAPAQPRVVAPGAAAPVGVAPDVLPAFGQRPGLWPAVIAAVLALAVGGIIGFSIGNSSDVDSAISNTSTVGPPVSGSVAVDQAVVDQRVDDILTLLLAQAQQNGSVVTPTPYPKLDQLLAIAVSSTAATDPQAADVGALTAERDQLAAQVTTLEDQVASVVAERDALQATLDSTASNQQQSARIAELEGQLDTASQQLADAQADLQTAQASLDSANATLDKLHVQDAPNFVGANIDDVRKAAASNGWEIIEATASDNTGPPNRVTAQVPEAGAEMIKGSVLYVEVAKPK